MSNQRLRCKITKAISTQNLSAKTCKLYEHPSSEFKPFT